MLRTRRPDGRFRAPWIQALRHRAPARAWGGGAACALLICLELLSGARAAGTHAGADSVLLHGVVLTMDDNDTVAQAVAIGQGQILAVGSDATVMALITPGTRVIDLHGQTVTPGLIDTHSHYAEASADLARQGIDLRQSTRIAEIASLLRQTVARAAPGSWVVGTGWDKGKLAEQRDVQRSDLDAVSPSNPVLLWNATGHYVVVNSVALRLAGLERRADPAHGSIERDGQGVATGILKEAAVALATKLIPPVTLQQQEAGILDRLAALHAEGITAIKEIGDPLVWQAYADLERRGKLQERVCMLWRAGSTLGSARAALAQIQQHWTPRPLAPGARLVACGAKIFMDGAIGAHTAWSDAPWYRDGQADPTGSRGYPVTDPALYRQEVRLFHRAGIPVGTHAIGDRAIDWVVDTYALMLNETPTYGLRHSIIHASLASPHAIAVMARLEHQFDAGYPETQPVFLWWLGDTLAQSLGPERARRIMPLKSYLAAGVRFSSGSDYPVVPLAARNGLLAAMQRQSTSGARPFGDQEAVDIHAALRSYTVWAAPQLFLEDQIGQIRVGGRADLAAWNQNFYAMSDAAWPSLQCEMTWLDGVPVFERAAPSPS